MESTVLAPGLLLAAPPLGDPNFSKSVVLLASHTSEGSLGWVVNGLEVAPVAQLLRDAGLTPDGTRLPETLSYAAKARVGGPVSPRSAWVLYRRGKAFEHDAQMVLTDEWAGTGDRKRQGGAAVIERRCRNKIGVERSRATDLVIVYTVVD